MRTTRIAAVPTTALLTIGLLAGCGNSSKSSSSSSSGAAATSSAADASSSSSEGASTETSAASSGSTSAIDCPTENTRKFAKTRFTTDVGLAAGTFHRWIYKPYKNGSFTKGHIDKSDAVKAAAVAAVDYKLLKNASENAKANPTLCKHVAQPLSEAMDKLKNLNTKDLLTGNVAGLVGANDSISKILSGSKESGNEVQEKDDLTEAKKSAG